jgi:hypothetical protein
MNHILHQNLLIEELKADIGRLQSLCYRNIDGLVGGSGAAAASGVDIILYINNHIQGLINVVGEMSLKASRGCDLSEEEKSELRATQELQDMTKTLCTLLYITGH